jgi:hypothetical protein
MMRKLFSLYFRGGSQVVLPQRLYRFVHEAWVGWISLSPRSREPQGIVYEVMFN